MKVRVGFMQSSQVIYFAQKVVSGCVYVLRVGVGMGG